MYLKLVEEMLLVKKQEDENLCKYLNLNQFTHNKKVIYLHLLNFIYILFN